MHDLGMRCFTKLVPWFLMHDQAEQHCTVKASNVVSWFNILHKIMHKQGTMFHTLNILKTVFKQY